MVLAGRRKGSVNRRTKALRAIAAEALESGVTSLEVMLENMRFYHAEAEKLQAKIKRGFDHVEAQEDLLHKLNYLRSEAQKCAVDAAPYLHPRLSAVAVARDEDGRPIRQITREMTVQEAAAAWAETLKKSPVPSDDVSH